MKFEEIEDEVQLKQLKLESLGSLEVKIVVVTLLTPKEMANVETTLVMDQENDTQDEEYFCR